MPKATCQLNLTLDVPVAESVEEVARRIKLRPSGAGRVLLMERLELERAGWSATDSDTLQLLARICSLTAEQRNRLAEKLDQILG